MKPFNLDICLKRSTLYWKKSTPRTIIIRANILAGKATKQPPLGSVLGTYGLNAENFCNQFNAVTVTTYNQNALLPTTITITPARTFLLKTDVPTVHSLFRSVLPAKTMFKTVKRMSKYKRILITTLYKIALAKTASLSKVTLTNLILQCFGVLNSYDLHELGEKSDGKFNYRKKKK